MKQLYMYKKIFVIFILSLMSSEGFSQDKMRGREFWLGFLRNFYIGDTIYCNVHITSEATTSGMVSIPLLNWSQNFTVNAGSMATVSIPSSLFPAPISGSIQNMGVRVVANDSISVFALNNHTDYYAMAYKGYMTHPSELMVVATQNGTQVELIPSTTTMDGKPAGVPFQVTLNQGQTYSLRANGANDISGTRIRGIGNCKEFAVFSGAVIANIPEDCPYADHIYSQMWPVNYFGKQYITTPLHEITYTCRVIASENNTIIHFNGGQSISLNAGQHFTWNKLNIPMIFNATKPILVAQFMEGMACAGKGDPAMALIPSTEQSIKSARFVVSNYSFFTENHISVVMKTAHTGQLKWNGAPAGNGFTPIQGKPEYSLKRILNATPGSHKLEADSGFIATVYGFGSYNSYLYTVGVMGSETYYDIHNEDFICVGAPIEFSSTGTGSHWSWAFPEENSFGNPVMHTFLSPGDKTVSLKVSGSNPSCPETITKEVYVNPGPSVKLPADTIICENASITINPSGEAENYLWSTGQTSHGVIISSPGNYWLEASNGDCKVRDTITVKLLPYPKIYLGENLSVCENIEYTLKPVLVGQPQVTWSSGEKSTELTITQPGIYWAEATNACGSASDSIEISFRPSPNLQLSADTTILIGTAAHLKASGSQSYSWSPSYGLSCTNCPNPIANPEVSTAYVVYTENGFGCMAIDTIRVNVDPNLAVYIPNIFSPNGDGINDILYVRGKGVKNFRFLVYNRWGEVVFETREENYGWDGTFRGQSLSPSVFVYYLDAILENDKRLILKGDVTLVR
jgi:gliding motility-associated-like protein